MLRRNFLLTGAGAVLAAGLAPARPAPVAAARFTVGVIGHTGRGGYGHGLVGPFQKMPEFEIVAVADADAPGLAREQARLKARGFADYRRMITEMRPDIVLICPRHVDQHHAMAMAAIEGGAKGIYMEKPLCRTVGEADEIVAAAQRHRVAGALAHRNRYHPALPVVRRLIGEGLIGKVLEIRGRGKEDSRGGAGDLWVLGSHVLNIGLFFTGRAVACTGVLLQDGRPVTKADVVEGAEGVGKVAGNALHVRFETEKGIPLFFDSVQSAAGPGAGFGLQIIGNEGIIDLRMDETPLAQHLPGNPFRPTDKPLRWTPITSLGLGQPEEPHVEERVMQHTLGAHDLWAAIRDGRPPQCSFEDGRALVEMMMATFASHQRGGARVALPFRFPHNPLDQG